LCRVVFGFVSGKPENYSFFLYLLGRPNTSVLHCGNVENKEMGGLGDSHYNSFVVVIIGS